MRRTIARSCDRTDPIGQSISYAINYDFVGFCEAQDSDEAQREKHSRPHNQPPAGHADGSIVDASRWSAKVGIHRALPLSETATRVLATSWLCTRFAGSYQFCVTVFAAQHSI